MECEISKCFIIIALNINSLHFLQLRSYVIYSSSTQRTSHHHPPRTEAPEEEEERVKYKIVANFECHITSFIHSFIQCSPKY